MDILQAVQARHSVRAYTTKTIEKEKINALQQEINDIKQESTLNFQIVTNDPDAFNTMTAHYGKFSNAVNYIAILGDKSEGQDTECGYYGERLVLLCQMLGLNTCWVALTYNKKKNKINIAPNEKLICVIAFGYGVSQGNDHKRKSFEQVTKNAQNAPDWFKKGVEYALLAPTALNQQAFRFSINGNKVKLQRRLGIYTKIDIGIVKYHFELAADKTNFVWE